MKEKILGAVMGLCVGDALGVPVEFMSREALRADPVTGMRGHGVHDQPPGTWSDDSSMALCLLDSLARGLDYTDVMQRFVSWMYEGEYTPQGELFDIGGITKKALFRFGRGADPLLCGGRAEHDNGNGSLMRVLPLVFHLHSRFGYPLSCLAGTVEKRERAKEEFFGIIHNVSSLTHAHPRSRIACGMYLCIAGAIIGDYRPSAVGAGLYEAKRYYEKREGYAEELRHFERMYSGNSVRDFMNLPEEEIRSGGYVVDTLEAALWCFLNTNSYESCVLKAVNLGGDTDTTAAVAGGLAGMAYGLNAIPEAWLRQLARRDYIEGLCSAFHVSLCTYTAERLRSYIPYLETVDPAAACELRGGEDLGDGTIEFPYYCYNKTILRFMREVYAGFLGYSCGRLTREQMKKVWSKAFIESADMETVQSILSYFARKERICEGMWAEAVKHGIFLALTRRLERLLLTAPKGRSVE